MDEIRSKSLKFFEDLKKEYKYVKIVSMAKKVKIKALKKKFNQCILVSNEIDIEKESWTKISYPDRDIDYFFTNLELIHPIEKLPIFKLVEIKDWVNKGSE